MAPVMAQAAANGTLLDVRDVSVTFGGIVALDGVSFGVARNQVVGLIGPNGAGKTTLFNCLSRVYKPGRGDILFEGRSIMDVPAHRISGLGIGRTFQNLALFGTMTVLENVMVGGHAKTKSDFVSNALKLPGMVREEARARDEAAGLIAELALDAVMDVPVAALPFGTQKRVEIARALMSAPKLLLLDEPAGGLNHEEVDALGALIRGLRDRHDLTVLLVEHHMRLVMDVSDAVVALDFGRKIAEGPPAAIRNDAQVIAAYLGTEDA